MTQPPGREDFGAAFATDAATAAYYERRATEYDEWYDDAGQYAARGREGWGDDVAALTAMVAGLPAVRTLDVACGTGYLTRHLAGPVVGLDRSRSMVAIARSRIPSGLAMVGDALSLPLADGAFDRVFTGHFYGHLPPAERSAFLSEASRVAGELVVVDAARRPGLEPEQWQERVLNDGSRHRIFKRYLTAAQLAAELAAPGIDTDVVHDGPWFVGVRARG